MQWKISPSFPDYEVSESGEVRRRYSSLRGGHKAGQVLTPAIGSDGYKKQLLTMGGRKINVKSHRLVAEAFIGPCPFEGAEVCHGDNDKMNCHYSNLRWDTHSGNLRDSHSYMIPPPPALGETNGQAKLTDDKIRSIRRLAVGGEKQSEIAKSFGLAKSTVSGIVNLKSWTHVV